MIEAIRARGEDTAITLCSLDVSHPFLFPHMSMLMPTGRTISEIKHSAHAAYMTYSTVFTEKGLRGG